MRVEELSFLVVEDNDFQRNAMVRMLKRLQPKFVHDAPNGKAALDLLTEIKYSVDIIFSDLEMPVMDGMQLIRHVGQKGYRGSVLIVSSLERSLLTTVETMSTAYGIQLLGAVEKPLTLEALHAAISRYTPPELKRQRVASSGPSFTLEEIVHGLDNHEFEPYFQPKVDLVTGQVKGAEALARWIHPQEGLVTPYAFIKTLEDNDMIDKLMWIMLIKAAAFCQTCSTEGNNGTVAVNLSLKSLADVKLADRVTEIVRGVNVEPQRIILEVTESAATTDVGSTLENLSRLRMKGFGLSIDDYGTGYSSMQQLTRIPFTELKIDQSFVANAATHESARVILSSSLDLARKLKISAVAEGVETQQHWDLLQDLGCDVAQGYFIARPMAGDAYCNWIRKRGPDPVTFGKS